MSTRSTWRAAGAIAALAIATTAVAGVTEASAAAKRPHASSSAGTLTLGAAFGTGSFNPWLSPAGDNEYEQVEGAVYDSLTHIAANGTVTPGLATSWKWVNPRTLILNLRTGVKFSDGTAVNAAAVKANFTYVKHATPAAQENAFITELTTKVLSPTKLELVSSQPDPDLLEDFAIGGGYIVSPKALKDPSELATHPDGSGPYVLTSAIQDQQWSFTRRKNYWDVAEYPYAKLVIKSFASAQAEDDALRSGQINGAPETTLQAESDKSTGIRIAVATADSFDGIWLSDRAGKIVPALGNQQVREAMNYAINRPAIMAALGDGYGIAGSTVLPRGVSGYSSTANAKYTYDVAKAKQLMAAAGYSNGFTLPVLSTPEADPLVEAIGQMESAIGITFQIEDHTTDYLSQAYSGNWAASVFAWTPVPAAQTLDELLSPTGLGNFNHSTDPTIDNLLTKVNDTDGVGQTKLVQELVTDVNTDGWFLIPGWVPNLYATDAHTTCTLGQRSVCELYTFRPVS